MQAILTSYKGPSARKGSRIKAYIACRTKALSIPYNHALSTEENHVQAAHALIKLLQWDNVVLQTGCLPNQDYCHVVAKS